MIANLFINFIKFICRISQNFPAISPILDIESIWIWSKQNVAETNFFLLNQLLRVHLDGVLARVHQPHDAVFEERDVLGRDLCLFFGRVERVEVHFETPVDLCAFCCEIKI